MLMLYLHGVGLLAPGLPGWRDSLPVLRGVESYRPQPLPPLRSGLLPANERRRTTQAIGLALLAGEEAVAGARIDPGALSAVFASSEGDCEIIDKLCAALAAPGRPVSPTLFHNSVHNAPAGYWSIATGCKASSLSLSAYDDSFSAGLLTAATLTLDEPWALLLAYDYPPPFPLSEQRRLSAPFAVALLLSARPAAAARLRLRLAPLQPEDRLEQAALEALRLGNPAARSLPLLCALAAGRAGAVILPYSDRQRLALELTP